MGIFNFLFKKSSKDELEPVKLTSYMEAAELICKCWNNLDASIIEPYLSESIVWKGETHSGPLTDSVWLIGKSITIEGKQNYLKYLEKVLKE